MKKFFMIATMLVALASCGGSATKNDSTLATDSVVVATEIVPAAATEVLPAAAPGPDAGGKVATDVIADSVAK